MLDRCPGLLYFVVMSDYFETLASAVDAIFSRAYADRCVFANPDDVFSVGRDHLAYEQNRTGDFALTAVKGKATRKYFHANIYRMHSGRYELTTYVL